MMITLIIIASILILFRIFPIGIFIAARLNDIDISFFKLVKYKFKNIPLRYLMNLNEKLAANYFDIEYNLLIECYNRGLDLVNISEGLIKARENKMYLTFDKACLADSDNIDIIKTIDNALLHVEKKDLFST
ncbi:MULTISPECIES: flotillin-like FloA family protein [unclassified Saccharicrinis]|uniref:flotillin-like FloA family protein n=1 Tax=unclassified Saccharicrinis TaxID=2646859 RepID=UPI0035D91029